MFTISKEFHFSASHTLNNLSQNHPCSNLHGHNYNVIVAFKSLFLDKTGFMIDYKDLDCIKKWIDENLDHKHLNDIFSFNPSAENIAKHLFIVFTSDLFLDKTLKDCFVSSVTIKETDKTIACYEP